MRARDVITRRGWVACACVAFACSAPPSYIGPATADAAESKDAHPSAAGACTDLAAAQCAELETCSRTLLDIRYGDVATCTGRLEASCERSLDAPSTGNSPDRAEGCAQAYATWSCADYLRGVNAPAACPQPKGTLKSGAACAFAAQCASGFCAIAPHAACGICEAEPAVGDSCANLSSCGQNLQCLQASKVCGTPGLAGAVCHPSAPCGPHLSCIRAKSSTNGTCQVSANLVGAACDPTLVAGPGCDFDAGLVCNEQSKTCEPLTVSGAGGPCDLDEHQLATCAAGGMCSTIEAGATGTCVGAAADGHACSTAPGGPACTVPARCVTTSTSDTEGTCEEDGVTACH